MKFLFDFLSPYAYLAWKRVYGLAEAHGRTVEPVPVLLAVLLDHHGHKGPAEIPAKREYVFKNVLRTAAREGIPIQPPPAHPFNPTVALSVACVAHPDRVRIIDVLFDATWGGGPGVADAATVAAVLDAAGFDGSALVARGNEARGRLRTHTDEAIAAGVFGVPTVVVDGELFWGFDAFPDIAGYLAGRDVVDPLVLDRWRRLEPLATRGGPHHGLSHVSVVVADLDRTLRFYRALGYTPYYRDDTQVQVVRPGGTEVLAFEKGDTPRIDHVGFRLKAPQFIDGVVAALVQAGGRELRSGQFEPGKPFAYVADPDGHEIEIWFE